MSQDDLPVVAWSEDPGVVRPLPTGGAPAPTPSYELLVKQLNR
jgi:hypothetical protein